MSFLVAQGPKKNDIQVPRTDGQQSIESGRIRYPLVL